MMFCAHIDTVPHKGQIEVVQSDGVFRSAGETILGADNKAAIAVILALFIRTFVVQAFKIPTGSMENNLLIGDHLLVNKFVFGPAARAERADSCASP